MKLQVVCFTLLLLVSFSAAQDYTCISGTVCDPNRLRSLAIEARDNLTDAVTNRLADLIERLDTTQGRIETAINSDTFRSMLVDELSGDITEFREGSSDFIRDLVQHLERDTASVRNAISMYTRNISFSFVEMIFQRIQDSSRFQAIISAVREAKQCFLENLYERGFMNTTNAVSGVIDKSRDTIDRIATLTRTALTDLTPARNKIRDILNNFRPIPSCLQIFSTSLGCRLCQFPDNEIALQASPCFEFCSQTVTYCLSVVRGALPGVRDVVRVIKLISEALEGMEIQERFRDTLESFGALVTAIEQLGENVFSFLKDFDFVDFIRDVANECFPDIVDALTDLYDDFKTKVRESLEALRSVIQGAIDSVKEGVDSVIDAISGLFGRRRRELADNELPLLDQVLELVVKDFCDNLPSGRGDECWNGTAIAAYNPETTADFSVASQADNPAVSYSGISASMAVNSASAEVSALTSTSSSNAVCDSLIISGGNTTLYNELSTSDEGCYEELNGSRASLIASSVFLLLTILVIQSLYLF